MQGVNIAALANNKDFAEPKSQKPENQEVSNQFSEVIYMKLSKGIINSATVERNKSAETATKKEETKPEENTYEQLLQLLMSIETVVKNSFSDISSIDAKRNEKLNQIVSEIIVSGIPEGINSGHDLKSLIPQIVDKLSTDSYIRTQLISKLSKVLHETSVDGSEESKEVIITELSNMIKKDVNYKAKSHAEVMKFEAHGGIQSIKNSEMEAKEDYTQGKKSQSTGVDAKAFNKENKLLEGLIQDSETKDTKEDISNRIANVVTRFEAIRIDKPAVAENQIVINRNNFNTDLIKAIKFMDINNVQELSVKIIPKDLGEIVIRLSMDNGVMKASILASDKETYNLLNSQLPIISNQLSEQNMNIQNFNLSLYNGDNFLFNGNENGEGERKQHGRKAVHVDSIASNEDSNEGYVTEDGNLNALA